MASWAPWATAPREVSADWEGTAPLAPGCSITRVIDAASQPVPMAVAEAFRRSYFDGNLV